MKSDTFIDIGNSITKWKFNNQYFELPTIDFEFESLPESYNIWVSNVSKKDFKVKNLSPRLSKSLDFNLLELDP